ncbi:GET complex subunit Get1 [Schizosaccharomyces japonicus yFS275]|uniref:Protein get1 n=1 Tax=Schizosaccharomyces japonicus (strain yFS275 / FY16936) TaxID=402676 RepID=GET1_SCHJY|nr:GET complex subunit Get1 [Schizosaccharomyces japonicus yFS275]B6JZY9.1 RecName: Full=Protein get1; AltName: Full=Guided entry of tail-anchored proteins 1 [Schizosaccharomyces japonicus yFS275]EEB06139.1 GET complex subunit Get1 [Schizosaccharomyces japonicus yFS275]
MDFLLFLFCLNLFIHLFDKYVKTFLVNQGFRVYARFSGSPEFKSYNDLRLQLLSTKRDLNNVSAQDEFAKWARLNRKFDQLNVKWEKQSKIVSQKSEGVKKLISLTFWIVTRGYRFIVQFKNSGNPVFAVPEGMLPTWALWFLALPKAKTGYVSVAVWNFASQKVISTLL